MNEIQLSMRGADYAALAAFVAVAQERSFRRAAARLGLTPSSLSHSLRELEERLGVKLLHRTTRSVATTEAGQELLVRLEPAFAGLASAVEGINLFRGRPAGRIRINAPSMAAQLALMPVLDRFLGRYPEIRLEIVLDEGFVDIVERGFDAGIRLGESLAQDMTAVRVTPDLRTAVVGSPKYFESHSKPITPHDLKAHACIGWRQLGSGAIYRWEFEKDGQTLDVVVDGPLVLTQHDLMVEAALKGIGLAYATEICVAPLLERRQLVRVLEDWCPPFPGYFLYYSSRRQTPGALRALIESLRIEAPAHG